MRALLVAGARPNFMKVAPILRALADGGHRGVLVHTGQHYDYEMSGAFFEDLEIPEPDYFLGVGSASHAVQTARCMEAFEPVLREVRPDWVVVVGDVNSTLACALVTAKLRDELGCRLAHVEAGLRSGDWSMPEEVNRVLTDRLADLCLTPSPDADENLRAEGIEAERIAFVGNVMIDTLYHQLPKAEKCALRADLGLEAGGYAVATLHRPSNVDDEAQLREIIEGFRLISEEMPLVLPLHPRTVERLEFFNLRGQLKGIECLNPLGYTDMLSLVKDAAVVLTDSGGLQEETTVLGVPCLTLRETTERPITVERGTNRLVEWPVRAAGMRRCCRSEHLLVGANNLSREQSADTIADLRWDGAAAERMIAEMTVESLASRPRARRVCGSRPNSSYRWQHPKSFTAGDDDARAANTLRARSAPGSFRDETCH
jgi:UDP-N-acetylglucosamine 2-epimerase (non-hydrolysing)